MFYILRYSKEDRIYTVGATDHAGAWLPFRDCGSEEEAFCFINYLNGGSGEVFDYST